MKFYLENIGMMMFPPCHVSKLKKNKKIFMEVERYEG